MKTVTLHGFSKAKPIAFTAAFAALCCIGTMWISVQLPASGYFNTGDVFVLLSGWFLGPLYGSVAAAVGSALADIFVGYASYAPATFLIKGLDAFVAYWIWALLKKCFKKEILDFLPRTLSAIVGELLMIAGYFLFESALAGSFSAAAPNLLGNGLQGLCCTVCAVILVSALYPIKQVKQFFPHLSR